VHVVWTNFIQAKLHLSTSSSSSSADLLRLFGTALHQVVTRLYNSHRVDASRLLVIDRAGSSSPTSSMVIIADNHLHQRTPSRRRHHRPWSSSTPTKSSPSPTSDAAQLQEENPGLIPDIFNHYNLIAIDNYHFVFVHHDLAVRVAV
jgi:hypothetical protein